MKKIFGTIATLAVALFVGCTTDVPTNDQQVVGGDKTITTLNIGLPVSKTQLGEHVDGARKVEWSAGDAIAVNGIASTGITINEENKGNASFTFEGLLGAEPYNILYPAEMYTNEETITLPAVQTTKADSFGADSAPMAAVTDGENTPILKHLSAVVCLQVKAVEDSEHNYLTKVIFNGKGAQVWGDFEIDYAAATLKATSTDEANQEVTVKVNKSLSTDEATNVYIVVPAQNYAEGFTVTLIDNKGHYVEKSKKSAINLAQGQIYKMPVIEFNPTGTKVDVEIASAAEWNEFAQAYNAGSYDHLNPCVVNVTGDLVFDDTTNAEFVSITSFNDVLYGNNKSIKNWKSTAPLFTATASGATIQDITIDEFCTITPVAPTTCYGGAFIAEHKTGASLKNCHNNADVTFTGVWNGNNCRLGGLVGRLSGGEIDGCTMNGDVTVDANFSTNKSVYLGGVTGCSTNANSALANSQMLGNLTFAGQCVATYFIGGVVGMFRGAEMSGCTTGSQNAANTVLVSTHTDGFTNVYVGGVAGQFDVADGTTVSITDCENYAKVDCGISTTSYEGELGVGGVVGYNTISLSEVANHGEVNVYPTEKTILCHNVYVGGVVGMSMSSTNSPSPIVIEAENNGVVLFAGHNDTVEADGIQHYYIVVGGILGYSYKGTFNLIQNSTNNGFTAASFAAKQGGRASTVGGIVGLLYNGASKIYKCTNNGHTFNNNFNNTNNKSNLNPGGGAFGGGIVGYAAGTTDAPLTIEECHNNCLPASVTKPSRLHTTFWTTVSLGGNRGHNGGLVGYCTDVTITNCTSKAVVYQVQQGYPGGLVGWMKSSTLQNCTMNATKFWLKSNVVSAGGLVGSAESSTISGNTFNSVFDGTATSAGVIAGTVDANTSITNNKVNGTFANSPITLDTKMIGSGTPKEIAGTTLYTAE